jgi:hypothetical protein
MLTVVSTPRAEPIQPPSPEQEAAERAARVGAMLDRWSKYDTATEPDWDIDDVLPLSLRDVAEPDAPLGR